jgi:hypothetical protein
MDSDEDTRPSDIMAPPRKTAATTPAPTQTSRPDDTVPDGTTGDGHRANGTPASGKGIEDASANGASANGNPAAADVTLADGVPALPADSIGSSGSDRETTRETTESKAAAPPADDDSPIFSFGPAPTAVTPEGPPPAADPPSLSPAAFAWEMPDPPPQSPSSPARAFLRSGTTAKSPAAKSQPAPKAAPAPAPGKTGSAAAPAPSRGPADKAQKAQKAQSKRMARQAHLTVARVEPWSVMKFSFVVSLVAFVILFVAVSLLYATLNGLGVFDSLQHLVKSLTSSQDSQGVNAKTWFSASRVLGYTAMLGSFNIVLITAMSTVGAVVYNLTSRLVGGVEVTLRETE